MPSVFTSVSPVFCATYLSAPPTEMKAPESHGGGAQTPSPATPLGRALPPPGPLPGPLRNVWLAGWLGWARAGGGALAEWAAPYESLSMLMRA